MEILSVTVFITQSAALQFCFLLPEIQSRTECVVSDLPSLLQFLWNSRPKEFPHWDCPFGNLVFSFVLSGKLTKDNVILL